jgi:hypothetical protein
MKIPIIQKSYLKDKKSNKLKAIVLQIRGT